MLQHKFYFKYNKLLKFNAYMGISVNKQRLSSMKFKSLGVYNNATLYYDFYTILIFLYKLRRIIKCILINTGNFIFFNESYKLKEVINMLVLNNNQRYFNFNKNLFKNFINMRSVIKIYVNEQVIRIQPKSFANLNLNSFAIILDKNNNFFAKKKTLCLHKYNIPILYLSQDMPGCFYYVPTSPNIRSVYY